MNDKRLLLAELKRRQPDKQLAETYLRYVDRPELWIAEQTPFELTPYQLEMWEYWGEQRRAGEQVIEMVVRGVRGSGKTGNLGFMSAYFIALHETLKRRWSIQTTAPALKTLRRSLWKEIRYSMSKVYSSDHLNACDILQYTGRHGEGVASVAPKGEEVNMEGVHSPNQLVIIEEAKGVRASVIEALLGSYSEAGVDGNNVTIIAISTPPQVNSGWFWDVHSKPERYDSWRKFHFTQEDAVAAGRVSREMVDKARRELGENNPRYVADWLGEFVTDSSESWVPPSWLQASNDRWLELDQAGLLRDGGEMVVGLDVAGRGQDRAAISVFNPRCNAVVEVLTQSYTENVVDLIPWALQYGKTVVVDGDGPGYGLIDAYMRRIELDDNNDWRLVPFHGGRKAEGFRDRMGYEAVNTRSAGYAKLYGELVPDGGMLALPLDDDLAAEVYAQRFVDDVLGGKVKVESKYPGVVKRLGRSPDRVDSVMMSLWSEPEVGHQHLPAISVMKIRSENPW